MPQPELIILGTPDYDKAGQQFKVGLEVIPGPRFAANDVFEIELTIEIFALDGTELHELGPRPHPIENPVTDLATATAGSRVRADDLRRPWNRTLQDGSVLPEGSYRVKATGRLLVNGSPIRPSEIDATNPSEPIGA